MKLCSGAFLRNDGRYPEKKSLPPPNPSALKKIGGDLSGPKKGGGVSF